MNAEGARTMSNDIQQNNIQHIDIKQNSNWNVALSIMTFNINARMLLCWVSFTLHVAYPFLLCSIMLSVVTLNVVMLSVVILNVVMLSVITLTATMLRVVILNVVMLSVMAAC